jgi:hypothetical protein
MRKRKHDGIDGRQLKKTLCEVCGLMVNTKSMKMHKEGKRHRNKKRVSEEALAGPVKQVCNDPIGNSGTGPARPMPILRPISDGLVILYQDDHIVCLDKPANFLATPGRCSSDSLQGTADPRGLLPHLYADVSCSCASNLSTHLLPRSTPGLHLLLLLHANETTHYAQHARGRTSPLRSACTRCTVWIWRPVG